MAVRSAVGMLRPGTSAGKRKDAQPGWDGGPYAFVRRVLQIELGNALY
jgi:hypothetical protein